MTVLSLQKQPEAATLPESERLRRAWLYAKAQWDLAANNPDEPEGLSDEENDRHCDETTAALNAYMLHPSENWRAHARKLRVFRDQQIYAGWSQESEIVYQIAADAQRLAFGRD